MPSRPARICACGHRVPSGQRCACQQARERDRPSARQRGYDTGFEKAAKAFLAEPGHERCECGKPAVLVRHRISIRKRPDLRMDRSNWLPGCRSCNARDARADQRDPGVVADFGPGGRDRSGQQRGKISNPASFFAAEPDSGGKAR